MSQGIVDTAGYCHSMFKSTSFICLPKAIYLFTEQVMAVESCVRFVGLIKHHYIEQLPATS